MGWIAFQLQGSVLEGDERFDREGVSALVSDVVFVSTIFKDHQQVIRDRVAWCNGECAKFFKGVTCCVFNF